MSAVTTLTGLGDAALLLPAAAVLFLGLVHARYWHAAVGWAGALALCVVLTVTAKMVFHACGGQFPVLDIRSPSGHTSLSTTFYGCGAMLFATNQPSSRRFGILLAGGALILAIAASRVALGAHTAEEAAAGLVIGLLCIGLYAASSLPRIPGFLDWRLPAGGVILLAVLTHGQHLSVESFLDRMADHWELAQYVCPLNEDAASKDFGTKLSAAMIPPRDR